MFKITLREKTISIVCGVFFCLFILEIGLRLGGFIFSFLQGSRNNASIQKNSEFRILCLGESTTALGGKYSYPNQLEEILNQRSGGVKFSVINKGLIAGNTSQILKHLEEDLDKYEPAIVVTIMGINDRNIKYECVKYFQGNVSGITNTVLKKLRVYRLLRMAWKNIVDKTRMSEINKIKVKATELTAPDYFSNKTIRLDLLLYWRYIFTGIDVSLYDHLGYAYMWEANLSQAEESFKKALELDPKDVVASTELGAIYTIQGKLPLAENILKKAIDLNPREYRFYSILALCYEKLGQHKLAEEYHKKANELLFEFYSPLTRNNYLKLKKILDMKNVRLICAQYPMLSIEPLKNIFAGQGKVIFIDNEKVFKDSVEKDGYNEYFIDMFAGDFGHCTPKGNRLLAENIANTILHEYSSVVINYENKK